MRRLRLCLPVSAVLLFALDSNCPAEKPAGERLQLIDVFKIEYASDPQVSPDGKQVVYVRHFMDIMKDRRRSTLWIVNADGTDHRPLTTGPADDSSPRWSPDGKRLLYVSSSDGGAQIFCRWMDGGQTGRLTHVTGGPRNPVWSPDGKHIVFGMDVPEKVKPLVVLPDKPEGAEWAPPARVIRKVNYRFDGRGYLKDSHQQLFLLAAEGGSPRQLTHASHDHASPVAWRPDGQSILFSANRHEDGELEPQQSDIHELTLADGNIRTLTSGQGPKTQPAVSPNGRHIAYVGFEDNHKSYQTRRLHVMNRDGADKRVLAEKLDRDLGGPVWDADGQSLFVSFDDQGIGRTARISLSGEVRHLAGGLGGADLGRPYAGGSFSASHHGTVAFTFSDAAHPADVALATGDQPRRLTHLNDTWLAGKRLGAVEEIWFRSLADGRKIQGWIIRPPEFDARKKYPLLLEIHGGPHAAYGPRFSAEMQLMAASGYVVLYINPRGSTGYGEEFAQLIHHNYPGQDYDDLMSGVDDVIQRGFIDKDNLFVTGGSGGGVLTAWIVGKTNRFRAAVASKPVINWYSFALTADAYPYFTRYWFSAPPWEKPEEYLKRSPISLVGNVSTPTMLLTGEEDYRTPISESEQYYQALKLRKIETALVRIPGASHGIGQRPSQMMSQVAHILKWFDMHRRPAAASE